MRWLRYEFEEGIHYGILEENDRVIEIEGSPLDSYVRTANIRRLDSIRILTPIVPKTFYCAGLNYVGHLRVADPVLGLSEKNIPTAPNIGYRANNALIAHGENIIIPKDATEKVQYEGELVVVIGEKAKNLSVDDAFSCVFGYTIGNDVSERTWQASDSTLWRSKNTDTFKPMGPWIETDVDLSTMKTTVALNGTTVSEFDTNNMVFSIATYISAMTRYLTLYPGDVIWMGTDGSTENIKAGDIVDIEISGIGTLTNTVVSGE